MPPTSAIATIAERPMQTAIDSLSRVMVAFPEPVTDDPTWARSDENTVDWLARSTLPRASGYRAFLNRNLAALRADAADRIAAKMRGADFAAAHFEMIVGRTLQLLEAKVEYEPVLPDGRQLDWLARVTDGEVVVECVCPQFDREDAAQRKLLQPLVDLIERLAPDDWSVAIDRLPAIGAQESRGELREWLIGEFAKVPSIATTTSNWVIEGWITAGTVRLELLPRRISHTKIVAGPSTGWWGNDTVMRIRDAVRTKRSQVRTATMPRIVAVHGGAWASFAAFDLALLGVGDRSDLTGDPAFVLRRNAPPTLDGVLAFSRVGPVASGPDPVLYRHPRSRRALPARFDCLEVRTTADGRALIGHPSTLPAPLLPSLSAGIEIP